MITLFLSQGDFCATAFRPVPEVQAAFSTRPIPDEPLCALLWEYKDRGKKGYDLTERFFELFRSRFPDLPMIGPERAGKDVLMGKVFDDYPNSRRPVDFVYTLPIIKRSWLSAWRDMTVTAAEHRKMTAPEDIETSLEKF
jgi:hypothetical protein